MSGAAARRTAQILGSQTWWEGDAAGCCVCVCLVYPEVDEVSPKRQLAATLCSISLQEANEIEGLGDKVLLGAA